MSEIQGKITQILGAVVDFEFPQDQLPNIYDAIRVPREEGEDLILEVQMHLGDNAVRTVAMDSTDRLEAWATRHLQLVVPLRFR
jgi:F-type H+-transporting ATPase subunit beta